MRERLAKLACTSAKIRRALIKKAGLPAVTTEAAKKWGKRGLLVGGGAMTGVAATGSFHNHRAGFDPAVQAVRTGLSPREFV